MLLIMKGQMNFFIKAILIVISVLAFTSIIFISQMSKVTTVEEKGSSELRMDALEILQKLINTKECLAYEYENVTQKGNLDIDKINKFVSNYSNFEPRCAKAIDFDYNIKITQFPKNYTLYPGKKFVEKEITLRYICSDPNYNKIPPTEFVFIACNYDPENCSGVCEDCREFDVRCSSTGNCHPDNSHIAVCDPDWGCGDDPLNNCPYTGSCAGGMQCPGGKPPTGVCCIYRQCPRDACEHVINAPAPGHSECMVGFGNCNLSKCHPINVAERICAHCTKGKIPIPVPSAELINITIPLTTWGFGVGFGVSSFSPDAARKEEIKLTMPITIRINETTMREGKIKITAVKGEVESLVSLIEDICMKAEKNPSETITVNRDMYFTYPITYNGTCLQMNSCNKEIDCPFPVNFENITQKGKFNVEINYNSGAITVKT